MISEIRVLSLFDCVVDFLQRKKQADRSNLILDAKWHSHGVVERYEFWFIRCRLLLCFITYISSCFNILTSQRHDNEYDTRLIHLKDKINKQSWTSYKIYGYNLFCDHKHDHLFMYSVNYQERGIFLVK
jgi:hypothetical protein